jgi:hypothetical protein
MWGWITALVRGLLQPFIDKWADIRHGETRQKLKQAEETIDDVETAQDVRRRLADDADYAASVRARTLKRRSVRGDGRKSTDKRKRG